MSMLLQLTDSTNHESVYAIDFEGKFLETSEDFYNLEGQNLVAKCDAPEYMKKVRTWKGNWGNG